MGIDANEFRVKLLDSHGSRSQPRTLLRRWLFDDATSSLSIRSAWLRLRENSHLGNTTLTYKERATAPGGFAAEVEVSVSDAMEMRELLTRIGLKQVAYQETYRETWRWKESQITIDEWPWIPTIAEIECPTQEALAACTSAFGLSENDYSAAPIEEIYGAQYDIDPRTVDRMDLTFDLPFGQSHTGEG